MAAAVIATLIPARASAGGGLAGSQGTDTSIPEDPASVFHGSGRGAFASLKITVNQTKNLTDQAVSVTWTGGTPTGYAYDDNFLQVFQCWGNDDGTHPDNPGPPPEQCEFGYGVTSQATGLIGRNVYTRILATSFDGAYFDTVKSQGYLQDQASVGGVGSIAWKPFRAVDGTIVNVSQYEQDNPYFNLNTTNEIDFAQTHADHTGSELFQVFTGKQAPGLGCGQHVTQSDGTSALPKCWLVIVPRGTAQQENPPDRQGVSDRVQTTPLVASSYTNRIAVPLEFNPTDASCPSGARQRIVTGSEVAATAANNWKPVLCSQPGSPPYAYQGVGDPVARQQLLKGTAGLAVTSQPLDPAASDPAAPVVYAPITLSGLVVGFNLDRVQNASGSVPISETNAEVPFAGTRVAHINLTPRLVAKLLTESYQKPFASIYTFQAGVSVNNPPPGYEWLKHNPDDLALDPDFIQYNPEFHLLYPGSSRTLAAALVEARISDGTGQLWQWVLADPEAKAWLGGGPDNNTPPMQVNPYYSTDPKVNPSGAAFGNPPPSTFPKRDPYCYQSPVMTSQDPPQPVAKLCLSDVNPYGLDLATIAQKTRAANDGAKIATAGVPPVDPSQFYTSDGAQILNHRSMAAVTDTASAYRFGLQVASLSRAGDDGLDRSFVAPDQAGLSAGAQAMVPSPAAASVLQPDPLAAAPGAYPLTVLTYAAAIPATLDSASRKDYARFVSYAGGDGQVPGFAYGRLPPGYAPLPPDLRTQAKAAADAILKWGVAPAESPTSTAPPQAQTSGGGGTGAGAAAPGGGTGGRPVPTTAATSPGAAVLPVVTQHKPSSSGVGSIARTLAQAVGTIRYTVPVAGALGLSAAVGWLVADRRRRRLYGKPDTR